ncbi:histidine phosphatase family protein [Profundibacter sp.]
MIQLAIIRHGYTPWNQAGRIQGRTDIALEARAAKDLERFSLPAEWARADLMASPLQRAVQTARIIADRAPATDAALTEMDWGKWEGKHGLDLKQDHNSGFRDIEDWGWDYRPPEGESPADIWARLQPWVTGLKRNTVAVCHIGIMRVLLAKAHGWDFSGPAPFRIKRNWLFLIDVGERLTVGAPERVKLQERG